MKDITRRDFLNGVALCSGAIMLSPWQQIIAETEPRTAAS
jgi:hypothetical protein